MSDNTQARILIVDDEACVRTVMARWLEREGYACMAAASAQEALALMGREEFSLLMSDINMPGMSGIELLSRVREEWPFVATVMVTGVDDRDTAVHTMELGAYGYVIKPFEPNELIIAVANALERRRLALATVAHERRLERAVRERTAQVRRREEEIALRLVSASEYRDEETGAHIRRIGRYAYLFSQRLGWRPEQTDDLRIAAPMHDIGKIGVPDSILLKKGKLLAEEFERVKTHTVIGASILNGSDVSALQMAKDVSLCHHEKWDGSGYPQGLAGEEIPLSARLVALVDVYDALVHRRVYRPALPEAEALDIMQQGRGSHFDPALFDCFIDLLPEFRRIRTELNKSAQPAHADKAESDAASTNADFHALAESGAWPSADAERVGAGFASVA